MKEMAAEAVAAAKDKRLTIIPSEFEATWFRQASLHLIRVQPSVCSTAFLPEEDRSAHMGKIGFLLFGFITDKISCETKGIE